MVTPDINGGYPAMLKNALDVAADRLSGKALGVVAVQARPGPQGVVAQLVTVGVALGMRPAQHHVVIDDPRHHVDTLAAAPSLSTQADLDRLVSELA